VLKGDAAYVSSPILPGLRGLLASGLGSMFEKFSTASHEESFVLLRALLKPRYTLELKDESQLA
jgi:hypothetical protein